MTLPGLTKGALLEIYKGKDIEKPIFQVLGTKKLGSGDRYRVLVSDSVYISSFTMLATQLNHIIEDGTLADFSIIEIGRYVLSQANNGGKPRRIMIILEVSQKAAGSEVGGKIGNPVPVEKHFSLGNEEEESANGNATPSTHPSGSNNAAQKRPAGAVASRIPEKKRLNETVNSGAAIATTPIAALSPYLSRWVIKVRVTNKSDVRSWSNSRGEGKLFSLDLVDESGEIRCTGFRESVDKFFDMIEMGKIYYISHCQLKPANKAFSNLKNDYEMTMSNITEIIPCNETSEEIPMMTFNFVSIADVASIVPGNMVDVLAIIKAIGDVQVIRSKIKEKDFCKRDLILVDMSNAMITLTLWSQQAENFEASGQPIIAIKGARVSEFNGGKSLGTISSTVLQIDPDHPDAHRLRGWWTSIGLTEEMISLSRGLDNMDGTWMNFKAVEKKGRTVTDNNEYYICKATISFIRSENAVYKACPTDSCNKKVVDHEGSFRCEKCNRDYPNFKYRMLVHLNIADYSGSVWGTAFNAEAEQMIGMTAQEVGELADRNRETYTKKWNSVAFTSYTFKVRMKMETYGDNVQLKSTIVKLAPVDYEEHNDRLLNILQENCNFTDIAST